MAKPWDDLMKMLVRSDPQTLVSFLIADATFQGEVDKELKIRTIHADLLYNVLWSGQKVVLHVEFQSGRDREMGRRVWEYNTTTGILTDLPVYSVVIYLVNNGTVVESPYLIRMPNEEITNAFFFRNLKLWELPREVVQQQNLSVLLPLLPLMKDGHRREVVEEMIEGLRGVGKDDLLPLAYGFAALVFEDASEQQWLRERFTRMQSILEESWAFREMMEKGLAEGLERGMQKGMEAGRKIGIQQGLEQGREQGREEGIEDGQLKALRHTLNRFVEIRFPDLAGLAQQRSKQIQNTQVLDTIIDKLYLARTVEQARQALLEDEQPLQDQNPS